MRVNKEYDHVLLKSDYWKKFEGTVLKMEKCKSPPKQSVETHSAWYLIPPTDTPGVNWDNFPEDVHHLRADESGFRGYVVEFYNVISDVVVQDGYVRTHTYMHGHTHTHTHTHRYQSILNLRTVLRLIESRHPRIKR